MKSASPKSRSARDLESVDRLEFAEFSERESELMVLVEPLMGTSAFKRLASITFLGILSPRFAKATKSPIFRRKSVLSKGPARFDGSRQSHSIGVALTTLDLCRQLNYSIRVQKYAVAWGLLHDLGNWPLSHTGETAFSSVSGSKAKQIRLWFINNDRRIPSKYWVRDELTKCGIDADRFTSLLLGQPDPELAPLLSLMRSPLTPDMLEGMWRTGRTFGVDLPEPGSYYEAIWKDLFDAPYLQKVHSTIATSFWRKKAEIYRRFFNSSSVLKFESSWSLAIAENYKRISLQESLELSEYEIIETVLRAGLPDASEVFRWKTPLRYKLDLRAGEDLDDMPLDMLSEKLKEQEMQLGGFKRNARRKTSKAHLCRNE